MKALLSQVRNLQNSQIKERVESRLNEFKSFSSKSDEEWFSELCFCILAANSKQKTAEIIQHKIKDKQFTINQEDLANLIRENKHRFHNNKSKYIIEARRFHPIKKHLQNLSEIQARDFLVNNIKGIGMKEASHFMRNTGSENLAILDRHIINILSENNLIDKPKTLTPKLYKEIESEFSKIAKETNMSLAELDLYMWYLKTGEIAK